MTALLSSAGCVSDESSPSYTVVAASGGGAFGYSNGAYGSINIRNFQKPPFTTALITFLGTTNAIDFGLSIDVVNVGQPFFTALVVQDSSGVIRRYTSASATYSGAGASIWQWGVSASKVWAIAGTYGVRIIF